MSQEMKEIDNVYFTWDEKQAQGTPGFNEYIQKKMFQSGLHYESEDFKIECTLGENTSKSLYAYQRTVEFAIRPETPIDRFLVLHATGSGKTITIIKILSNYYTKTADERTQYPKIVILKDKRDNKRFFEELLDGIDNPYSRVFKKEYESAGVENLYNTKFSKEIIENTINKKGESLLSIDQMREIMCKGKTTLLNECIQKYKDMNDQQIHTYFKIHINSLRHKSFRNFLQNTNSTQNTAPLRIRSYVSMGYKNERQTDKFYNNEGLEKKFIILDEYHSFLTKHLNREITNRKDSFAQTQQIREELKKVKKSVIIGCTATPLVGNTYIELLNEIRGIKYPAKSKRCDEGFVSYMLDYPVDIYPTIIPGVPTQRFPNLRRVVLSGENKKQYKTIDKIMDNGCYKTMRFDSSKLKYSYFNKFYTILYNIIQEKKKTLILIDKGAAILYKILKEGGVKVGYIKGDETDNDTYIKNEFQSKDNKHGEKILVLVANIKKYGTGHNFITRKLILVNPPETASLYLQYLGRALRSCLYKKEFNNESHEIVELIIYCSCFQKSLTYGTQKETQDELILKNLVSAELPLFLSQMDYLKEISIDNTILQNFYQNKHVTSRDDLEFHQE
jgi:superfamily II DNA or RNA helicase